MSAEARAIIGQWRKEINTYRKTSKEHVKNYIKLVERCNDEEKVLLIEIYGNYLKLKF